METEARVARGAAALYLASVVGLVLNTIYFVILTNFIDLDEVGFVSLLNILVAGTATLATLALPAVGSGITATPPAVTRFLSQYMQRGGGSARKVYLLSLGLCATISLIVAAILSSPSGSATLAGHFSSAPVLYAAIDAVASSFSQLGVYSLIGGGRSPLAGKLLILSGAVKYSAASILLAAGYAVSGVFLGFALGDVLLAVIGNLVSARMVSGVKDEPLLLRPIATYMVSVMLAAFIGFGVAQVDKLLAFFQQGLGNLGVYNVATVGAAVASFAPSAVTNVLVPALGSLRPEEGSRRRELMKNYTRYIMMIAAPMGFGLAAVSPFLLHIFGEEYLGAAPILSVIAISVAFTSIGSVYSSDLLVDERVYFFSASNAVGLAGLVAVALALVPLLGLLGVAIGRSVMLILTLLTFLVFVRRKGDLVLDTSTYAKSTVASAIMGGIVYATLDIATSFLIHGRLPVILSSLAMILVGFGIYFYLMKLLRGFSQSDLDFLEKLLPKSMSWVVRLAKRLL